MAEDEVELKITISRNAYNKAIESARNKDGPAGELAGSMSAEEYIERMIEIAFED